MVKAKYIVKFYMIKLKYMVKRKLWSFCPYMVKHAANIWSTFKKIPLHNSHGYDVSITVEPPNKGHFGNGPLVLCSEVVPISEVHDFSTHFDCIILKKLINALKCMIRAVEMILNQVVGMFCNQYQHSTG